MAKAKLPRDAAAAVADEVRSFCERKADPERAAKYARYFREGYDAYGIHHEDPDWSAGIHQWSERLQSAGPLAYLDAGDILVRTGKYEEASAAIRFAELARQGYTPEVLGRLGGWFQDGIRNWGHTDVFSALVLGVFLTKEIVGVEAFHSWRDSPHKYQRRAVPVTLIELLKKKGPQVRPLLQMIEPLMMDGERVVQQGVGWFLRECWKVDRVPVEKLLLRYKDRAPRLIFQYATEKMTAAERERFRKSKAK